MLSAGDYCGFTTVRFRDEIPKAEFGKFIAKTKPLDKAKFNKQI